MLGERDARIRELEEIVRMLKEKLTACEGEGTPVEQSTMEDIIEESLLEEEDDDQQ